MDLKTFTEILDENKRLCSLFDHSEFQDEGGYPAHLTDHTTYYDPVRGVRRCNQLDRMIMEMDSYRPNGRVLVPHPRSYDPPLRFRLEVVARRAKISLQQAQELVKAMKELDFTDEMADDLFRQITMGGYVMSKKVRKLANEMEKVTEIRRDEEGNPVDAMEYRAQAPENNKEGNAVEDTGAQLDHDYHPLGDDPDEISWLDRQPRKFCCLYRAIHVSQKLKGLRKLGAFAYQFNMIAEQERCLWDLYRAKEASLFKRQAPPRAIQAVGKIRRADYGQLRTIGAYLYRQPVTDNQDVMAYIWKQYRSRKAQIESEILFNQM